MRGGPHDWLAAMLHLGRAIDDAPESRFPAGRLASVALEAAMAKAPDAKLAEAALRALGRASDDAPRHPDILEAMAALLIRLGRAREAEQRLNAAIAQGPPRPRLYALLSEALRAQGNLDGALATLTVATSALEADSLLETERGIVLLHRGELQAAQLAWEGVLRREACHAGAFANLSALASRKRDPILAEALVDHALATPRAHPEVLRRAIQLSLMAEPDGIARASRVAELARRLVRDAPEDPSSLLVLARAMGRLGDARAAVERLVSLEKQAPGTPLHAESLRARFALEHPKEAEEVEAALRAASSAQKGELAAVAARARLLAMVHDAWLGWLACAIAERRAGRFVAAREASEAALLVAPGAGPARAELVAALLAMGEPARGVEEAERARVMEGDSPRTLGMLARALFAAGRTEQAHATITRALALDEADESNRALAERIREKAAGGKPGALEIALAKTGAALRRLLERRGS